MTQRASLRLVALFVAVALGLWYFAFQTELWNFWARLSLAVGLLALWALVLTPDRWALFAFGRREVLIGLLSALGLYLFFWVGKALSTAVLPFAAEQISSVYANKAQLSPVLIGLLLLFVLGPGEEIFWRGFVQRQLAEQWGGYAGWLATTAVYALVHLWTLNAMLVLAAAAAGLVWGWIYWRERNLTSVIISHALWDLSVFVLFPLG